MCYICSMKIFEAYQNTKLRIRFKSFIEAEGMSLSKREQIYTRFGTYISRIRSVGYDKMLLEAPDEMEFTTILKQIFFEKWKNNIGYPEIPDYFFRYLDFLRMQTAIHDDIEIDGLARDENAIQTHGGVTKYEERFVAADGRLRMLANPALIRLLRNADEDGRVGVCRSFYSGHFDSMSDTDWKALIEELTAPKRKSTPRGEVSFEVVGRQGESRILNSYQAMRLLVDMAGVEKVEKCPLKLNGKVLIMSNPPTGNKYNWIELDGVRYLNAMGSMMDRFKVMRALVSIYRLPVTVNLSKERSVKTPHRKNEPVKKEKRSELAEIVLPEVSVPDDFVYGSDGTLNLFDD